MSRHPYTHAADALRDIAPALSRSEAACLRAAVSSATGLDDAWLASILSCRHQIAEYGHLDETGVPDHGPLPDIDPFAVAEAIASCEAGRALDTDTVMRLSGAIVDEIDGYRPGDVTLTRAQEQALADLVSFAMIGFALLKNDLGVSEKTGPVIAPFLPLVEDELDERSERRRAEIDRRYGYEDPSC